MYAYVYMRTQVEESVIQSAIVDVLMTDKKRNKLQNIP